MDNKNVPLIGQGRAAWARRSSRWPGVLAATLVSALASAAGFAQTAGLPALPESLGFPFAIQEIAPDSPVSAAWLNDHVAGSRGWVKAGPEGHLWLGDSRQRFVGLNCTFIPEKSQAPALARRLAALGVNIVRFHHIDAPWGQSLLSGTAGRLRAVADPAMLDRLDCFAAELKKKGIYLNLNLLTGRQFSSADGLPPALDQVANFKARHVPGFWNPAFLAAQQDWARQLLLHTNPYTGLRWVDDPALAVVEINNENGLVQAWLSRWIDELDASLVADLKAGWNRWLLARFGSQEALRQSLRLSEPLGPQLLQPLTRARAPANWNLEQHAGAKARLTALPDRDGVRLEVLATGTEGWHVQLNQSPLDLAAGRMYTLVFKARSPGAGLSGGIRQLVVGIGMAHEPWEGLGFDRLVDLGPDWQTYRLVIPALGRADTRARLNFSGLGLAKGTIELAEVSLQTGGDQVLPAADIGAGSFPVPLGSEKDSLNPGLRRLWLDYLYEHEDRYWARMLDYLRGTLGVKSLVAGTIVGCSTPGLMERFDIVDTHAYWNHPAFPGRDWDGNNYWVSNRSLVRDPAGGALTELALKRVLGKPFSVSEYDHPWPNQYAMEQYPLLASFACFQDWDMIYGFTLDTEPLAGPQRISGYFDQTGHPLKAGALPFAARIFRQGLVAPGPRLVEFPVSVQAEREALVQSPAWNLFDLGQVGVPRNLAIQYRLGMWLVRDDTGLDQVRQEVAKQLAATPQRAPGDFEGGQIRWDAAAGRFAVTTGELLLLVDTGAAGPATAAGALPYPVSAPWGLGFATTDLPACLVLLPSHPAPGAPLLAFTGRAAGNTRERLAEYAGPWRRGQKAAADPYALDKVTAAALTDDSRAWALGTVWQFLPWTGQSGDMAAGGTVGGGTDRAGEAAPGPAPGAGGGPAGGTAAPGTDGAGSLPVWRLEALDAAGRPGPAARPDRTGAADRTIWYLLHQD